MFRPNKITITFASIVIGVSLVFAFIVLRGRAQSQNGLLQTSVLRKADPRSTPPDTTRISEKELDDAATPIVDFLQSSSRPTDESRRTKNKSFDGRKVVIAEPGASAGEIVIVSESVIPDLPFGMSDLVIEGEVRDSNAYLSDDRSGVYSEFLISVSDVIKFTSSVFVKNDDVIITERFGGRVRYPSGRIVRYSIAERGSPTKGKKYLFFLKQMEGESYRILTAYELRGNKVFPLDGSRTNFQGKGNSIFDKHSGKDLQEFRRELRESLAGGN